MIASYDFTYLAWGLPPRHEQHKLVILSVVGAVAIPEVDALERLADIELRGGVRRELFASEDGRVFLLAGPNTPELFSDGPGGLDILTAYRRDVEERIASMARPAWRTCLHPGRKIESPSVFSRVDIAVAGLNSEEREAVEAAREKVEKELSNYVHLDGNIFLEVPEPFLVVWKNVSNGFGSLSREIAFDHDFWTSPDLVPLACFRLGEEKAASEYVSSFNSGPRRPLRGRGEKVTGLRKDLLSLDVAAMTLRGAAMRVRQQFIAYAEGFETIEAAMLEVPFDAFASFRALCGALENCQDDPENVDSAIQSCLEYDRTSGASVFSWDNGGPDSLAAMMAIWESRPVEAGDILSSVWLA